MLAEAGLAGQVRVGASLSAALPSAGGASFPRPGAVHTHDPSPRGFRGGAPEKERAEEAGFPLDDLLRPLQRPQQGRLIELAGELSSGRTALAYRFAAGATARGELVGWVDLPDALDPRFLRRSGVELERLLWTRPPHARAALRAAELLTKTGFAVVVVDLESAPPRELGRLGNAAWSRLLRALRGARATAVVLGSERIAGSFSTLGLYTERRKPIFDRGLFEGLEADATVVRNRAGPTDIRSPFRVFHQPTPVSQ